MPAGVQVPVADHGAEGVADDDDAAAVQLVKVVARPLLGPGERDTVKCIAKYQWGTRITENPIMIGPNGCVYVQLLWQAASHGKTHGKLCCLA